MQTYLVDLQNNLPLVLPATLAGILISCLLLGLIMATRGRSRLKQQRSTLEAEAASKREEHEQLNEDFGNAQQKIQEFETLIAEKDGNIEELKKQQQAAEDRAAHTEKLEGHIRQRNQQLEELLDSLGQNLQLEDSEKPQSRDIWADDLWARHNEVVSELTTRLIREAQVQGELQQGLEAANAKLSEKDAASAKLEQELKQQAQKLTELEQNFAAQKESMEQLQHEEQDLLSASDEKLQQNQLRIAELEQLQSETAQQMKAAQETSEQLQLAADEKNTRIEQMEGAQQAVQQELADKSAQLELLGHVQEKNQLLERELNEKSRQLEFMSGQTREDSGDDGRVRQLESELERQNALFAEKLQGLRQSCDLAIDNQQELSLSEQCDGLFAQLSEKLHSPQADTVAKPEPVAELAEKDGLIEELRQTVQGQENHIARLQDDLDMKKEELQAKGNHGVPAAILQKQQADETRIAELEKALADSGKGSLTKTAEKVQHLPEDLKQQFGLQFLKPLKEQIHGLTENAQKLPGETLGNLDENWVNPAKEQIGSTTEKVKHLPEQLKGFFSQKLSALKKD